MNVKDIKQVVDYMYIMNRKFGWKQGDYKLLHVKKTKKGFTFFCWFDVDEVIEVMVNKYACDAYDVSDIWMTLIWK